MSDKAPIIPVSLAAFLFATAHLLLGLGAIAVGRI
jgi:hypothetical protein